MGVCSVTTEFRKLIRSFHKGMLFTPTFADGIDDGADIEADELAGRVTA